MKISKIAYLLVTVIILSGCGLSNMASKYENVTYKVKPSILEVHGGKITLNLDASFPQKYFAKNVVVDFTPVLVYPGGEKSFKTISIQGESATGGEKTIFFENGGSFSYEDVVKYTSEMSNSTLELRAVGREKSKLRSEEQRKPLGPVSIAKGVITTPTRVKNNEEVAIDNHNYERETILEEKATIYFLVNQAEIRTTEKSKEEIKRLQNFANQGNKTHSIEIVSYASPEGSVKTNDEVSERRMKNTVRYIKRLLKSLKIDGADNNDLYTETSLGEDWEGFESIVKSSSIKDKRRINKIVNSVEDLEIREQQIRDLSEIYDALKDDVLPQLRKAVIIIRSFEPKRTDEEIAKLAVNYPDSLDIKELLFSASLTKKIVEKKTIYNKVIELHNDWRGYNNLGAMFILEGELNQAMNFIEKAEKIAGEKSDILTNKGIIAARKGQLKTAQKFFNEARTTELNQAILDIRQGEYEKAVRFFKNSNSYNATLAKVLNGNNKAKCNENNASCFYLNAISYAREKDYISASKHLEKAIKNDSSYKKEALKDLEFIDLRENEDFIKLTK